MKCKDMRKKIKNLEGQLLLKDKEILNLETTIEKMRRPIVDASTNFSSRLMPNVKFRINFEQSKLFDFGMKFPKYATTSSDGMKLTLVCAENERSTWAYVDLPEVSIYEAMPEIIAEGMRYNKELSKLVPDVLHIPKTEGLYDQAIFDSWEKAKEVNRENLNLISPVIAKLSQEFSFGFAEIFQVVRDNFLFKGHNNLEENSRDELNKMGLYQYDEEYDLMKPIKNGVCKDCSLTDTCDVYKMRGDVKINVCEHYSRKINVSDMGYDENAIEESPTKNSEKTVIDDSTNFSEKNIPKNKYDRKIFHKYISEESILIDVYSVLKSFDVKCPALQHLIKKALCAGLRGHKNIETDLQDIIDSAIRAKELNKEF